MLFVKQLFKKLVEHDLQTRNQPLATESLLRTLKVTCNDMRGRRSKKPKNG